jgi:hypothetical protein
MKGAKAMAKELERELLEATGQKPQKESEDRQKYLARLIRAVNDLSDKEYGKLSDPLQEYLGEATEALNDKKEIADFPGGGKKGKASGKDTAKSKSRKDEEDEDEEEAGEDADEESEDAEDAEEEEDPKPRRKSKSSKKASRKAKASDDEDEDAEETADEEEAAPRKAKVGKPGAVALLRKTIVMHPTWKRDKVREYLEKKGFDVKDNTLSIHYYEARSLLKLLNEAGHLSRDYAKQLAVET